MFALNACREHMEQKLCEDLAEQATTVILFALILILIAMVLQIGLMQVRLIHGCYGSTGKTVIRIIQQESGRILPCKIHSTAFNPTAKTIQHV
ncbi:hypothetical protein QR680_000508 [Steinernema hermaphroditum]|uniref:Uncharacterized protein n=1 Tax=Steinernema hermaphroditum TaxID=289476 RepID=A0AA39GVP7_9BILA|nr:hypothetical protein QR680_000508 [Steinernema hermaphroditum]